MSHEQSESARVLDTTLLMALAAVLIANSHLEAFYPRPWLAGDGLIGNSLFFLLSGYGLARSGRFVQRGFGSWFWRRLVRIYPTVLLGMLTFAILIAGEWRNWTTSSWFRELIWPTRFSFVELIMPFYVLFFFLIAMERRWIYPALIAALSVLYLALYLPDAAQLASGYKLRLGERPLLLHSIAYFQVMLLGGWLAWRRQVARPLTARASATLLIGALYVLAKFAMVTGHWSREYMALHVLTFVLCYLLFDLFTDSRLLEALKTSSGAWRAIGFVGGLTLEIFVVHSFVIGYEWVSTAVFPLNLVLFWSMTLTLAYATGIVSRRIQDFLLGGSRAGRQGSLGRSQAIA